MATKKAKKTAKKTTKQTTATVARAPKQERFAITFPRLASDPDRKPGMCAGFRAGSAITSVAKALADGKAHKIDALDKLCAKPDGSKATIQNRLAAISKHVNASPMVIGTGAPKTVRLTYSDDYQSVSLAPAKR
jgi:hypothetical protein